MEMLTYLFYKYSSFFLLFTKILINDVVFLPNIRMDFLLIENSCRQEFCSKISSDCTSAAEKTINAVLQQRVIGETWDKPLVGDLICKHGARGRTFEATAEDIDSEEFQSRVASIEVSPSGPLWGKKMREPTGDVFEQELAVLHTFGLDQVVFCRSNHYGTGARRPLRVPVANTRVSDGIDAHGPFVLVKFSLPAGSYATVVIELLLNASP